MQEPLVHVGILCQEHIVFIPDNSYSFHGRKLEGEQQVRFDEGKIRWQNNLYDELLFVSDNEGASFVLKDVVIGINFHWERREDQRFEGSLKLVVEGEKVRAINIIPVEKYLTSVISSEMSATASPELLKAHAVISRSWLLAIASPSPKVETYSPPSGELEGAVIRWYERDAHTNFDVCADDHCQRYQGISRASENIDRVKTAIESTRGEVLYFDGQICDARFSKCCGGAVEEFQNCWDDRSFPYLKTLRDDAEGSALLPDLSQEKNALKWIQERPQAFCNTTDSNILSQVLNNYDQETRDFYRWTQRYTTQELSELIKRRSGIDFGTVTDLIPQKRGTSGRIVELKIVGTKRTMTIGKELEIRRTLSESHLYSSAFYVEKSGDEFILHGAGWGHGVGLCQIGAAVMGEKGYSYHQILLHYYLSTEIKKLY